MTTQPKKKLRFKNDELPAHKVDLATNLKVNIPSFLKNSSSTSFGCPDCRDQGAYYVEFTEKSETKAFVIDTDTSEIPKEIRPFVVEIEKALRQL